MRRRFEFSLAQAIEWSRLIPPFYGVRTEKRSLLLSQSKIEGASQHNRIKKRRVGSSERQFQVPDPRSKIQNKNKCSVNFTDLILLKTVYSDAPIHRYPKKFVVRLSYRWGKMKSLSQNGLVKDKFGTLQRREWILIAAWMDFNSHGKEHTAFTLFPIHDMFDEHTCQMYLVILQEENSLFFALKVFDVLSNAGSALHYHRKIQ